MTCPPLLRLGLKLEVRQLNVRIFSQNFYLDLEKLHYALLLCDRIYLFIVLYENRGHGKL